jgi:hypothetical protein
MGYSTDFKGELRLRAGTTVEELRKLKELLEMDDARAFGMKNGYGDLGYIDLELTKDLGGLKWTGAEKTRGMTQAVTMIVGEMRKTYPAFTLEGTLQAQGEDAEDRWDLVVEGGTTRVVKYRMVGEKVKCPECRHEFAPGGQFEPV